MYKDKRLNKVELEYLDLNMKNLYIAPKTEAIEILSENILMASPAGTSLNLQYGQSGSGIIPR